MQSSSLYGQVFASPMLNSLLGPWCFTTILDYWLPHPVLQMVGDWIQDCEISLSGELAAKLSSISTFPHLFACFRELCLTIICAMRLRSGCHGLKKCPNLSLIQRCLFRWLRSCHHSIKVMFSAFSLLFLFRLCWFTLQRPFVSNTSWIYWWKTAVQWC